MLKLIVFILISLPYLAMAQGANYVKMAANALTIKDQALLVVSLSNTKDWHTYWKNPGDAGLTIKFEFSESGKKIKLNELEWPTPKKYIEQGGILAYGYSDTNHFFFKIPDNTQESLKGKTLSIKGTWLVCKDICIPGQKEIKINLDNGLNGSTGEKFSRVDLEKALNWLPKKSATPKNLEIYLTKAKEDNKLALQYTLSNFDISKFDKKSNLLTPFLASPFDYKHEKLFYDADNRTLYGRIYIDWDGVYEEPEWPLPDDGILKKPIVAQYLLQFDKSKPAVLIEHSFNQFSMTGDESLEVFFKTLTPMDKMDGKQVAKSSAQKSIFMYLVFAFLGGLILNLMPCVLPVISLKLFGLIVHSDEPKSKILRHNLFYTLGVVVTFWALAAVVLLLKSSGEQVGWGFQLQSPLFVFIMLVVLFIMSLNMLGLFEFVTPGGKTLGNVQMKSGMSGDFMSGVLATILSTPCSAPFLGAALTFAFTTSSFNIFLILTFVGLGLAFPFVLTGAFPALVSFLPKPGVWMEKLKNLLGISLLLTFVWLYDVLFSLVDTSIAGIYINTFFVSIFFAFYFRKQISKSFLWNAIIFAIPFIFATTILSKDMLAVAETTSMSTSKEGNGLEWSPWSEDAMAEMAEKRQWVFMDFTASWCLTCKVNKKLVLNTESFAELAKEQNLKLMVGDWTKRDENITRFLRKYNVVGVPAYFIQKPNGEIIHLGETISVGKIKKSLE
jgi:thiol:disulfide interchange protein